MAKGFDKVFMQRIQEERCRYGTLGEMSRAVGVSKSTLSRWLNRMSRPSYDEICRVLDALGLTLAQEGEMQGLWQEGEFISIPIVRTDVPLPPGPVPESVVTGRCLVDRRFQSVVGKTDQVVVEIVNDVSKTIREGSLVLVDRLDRKPEDGGLFLVQHRDCMGVRRIRIAEDGSLAWAGLKTGMLTFHSQEQGEASIVGRACWVRGSVEDGGDIVLDR